MTRLHADPVEVRTAVAAHGPEPEQFLWRGRLYVVREVLARWTCAGAWWRGVQEERAGGGGGPGTRCDSSISGVDDGEQQWWRVEAGRKDRHGTYDLCFSWSTGWTLRRVID